MATNFNFKNKVIAITGGASGIGLATATLLLSRGAKVSIADVQASTLSSDGEGQIMSRIVDVADEAQVHAWITETVAAFGKLDGAVNAAGVIPRGINIERIEELDSQEWARVLNVNLSGTMYCLKAQIPQMKLEGSIVNTASVAGLVGFAKNAAYVASKHAVIGLTRSAAKEVGDRGIRVNCIAPGIIDTPMHRMSKEIRGSEIATSQQIKRKGQASEVASLIGWLLCDESSYITGTVQTIDGGWIC